MRVEISMSDSSTTKRPSRAKVWRHFIAGDPLGSPLAEWAYRTPRFPSGITGSQLAQVASETQRETMIVWFLANHIPAAGDYFGFPGGPQPETAGPLNTNPLNTVPLNQGVRAVGFGQGPFLDGGRAPGLLSDEFKDFVSAAIISEVANAFGGLWQRIPPETLEGSAARIVAALDDISESVRKLVPGHGQLGHNGPPDDAVGSH
jgi:hypothetical protein